MRHAFQLQFEEKAFEPREPRKVLQVAQRCDFIRLAKAIATELRWLPEDELLAVETLEELIGVEMRLYIESTLSRSKDLSLRLHIGVHHERWKCIVYASYDHILVYKYIK